jgi:hypothetical protein
MKEPYIGMIVEGGSGSNQPHGTTIRQYTDGTWRVVAIQGQPPMKTLRDRHGRWVAQKNDDDLVSGFSPIMFQKYLARGLFAVVVIALACAFTWASAWMWP